MGKVKFAVAILSLPLAAPVVAADPSALSATVSLRPPGSQGAARSSIPPPRLNLFDVDEERAGGGLVMPEIPFLSSGSASKRERGFSFSVRPVKGIRATARLRF